MTDKLFGPHTQEEQSQSLANYLPNGRIFAAKNQEGTNLKNLIFGLGIELFRAENKQNEIICEHFPADTELLLSEWESALGIPDNCIPIAETSAERRENIITKLTALGVSTKEGFEALALELGFSVRVDSGARWGIFPMEFPVMLFNNPSDARFTMVVDFLVPLDLNVFDFTFPVVFGNVVNNVIICLFERLRPANADLIFRFNLPETGALGGTWVLNNTNWNSEITLWENA